MRSEVGRYFPLKMQITRTSETYIINIKQHKVYYMCICVFVSPQQILSNCEFGNCTKQPNRRCSKYCLRTVTSFKLGMLFENNRCPKIRFVQSDDNDVSTSVATVYIKDQFPYRQLINVASTYHSFTTQKDRSKRDILYIVCVLVFPLAVISVPWYSEARYTLHRNQK